MDTQKIEEQVSLTSKAAIVTGAGTTVGRFIAGMLADAGAAVLLVAESNWEEASKVVDQIRAEGGAASLIRANLESMDDAERAARAAVEGFGNLDILVNSLITLPSEAQSPDAPGQPLPSAAVKGASYYCRAAARRMIELGRSGRIVNLAPVDAVQASEAPIQWMRPRMNIAVLSRLLAEEYEPYHIHVNALLHGTEKVTYSQPQAVGLLRAKSMPGEQVPKEEAVQVALAPAPDLEYIATTLLFLLSSAADDITGQLVVAVGRNPSA